MEKPELESIDSVVLYDIFWEAANRVIACHVEAGRRAASDAEREQWRARVREIMDLRESVDADDLERQTQLTEAWNAEFARLSAQLDKLDQ